MNFSVDQMCNMGGCFLIFVLLFVLIFKPKSLTGLIEGQSRATVDPQILDAGPVPEGPVKVAKPVLQPPPQQNQVMSSLPLGENEQYASVKGMKTPTRRCYPENTLQPDELLPNSDAKNINNFNKDYPVSEGILKGVNFLEAGYQVGVNTVGQSLRNANQQLRAEPANPQVNVSPWLNTTIGPDLGRRPLELGEDCYAPSQF
jgi:hypothetical protein